MFLESNLQNLQDSFVSITNFITQIAIFGNLSKNRKHNTGIPLRIKKLNTNLTGVLSGIILPGILFFVLYYARFRSIEFIDYPGQMIIGKFLPVVLSWCIIPNLLLFFVFNWIEWLKAAMGIIVMTVILTVLLFAIRFLIPLL